MSNAPITYWHQGISCVNEQWENAYTKFETPSQEIKKFVGRFKAMGAERWTKDAQIVDLFCGRGNGLVALEKLGFQNLNGVDLSPDLVAQYDGPAKMYVADCRFLKFDENSIDYVTLQGGLHHLESIENDVNKTLAEIHRSLKPNGHFVSVEPWNAPFLRFMHLTYKLKPIRAIWGKLDALATMTELEYPIYNNWIGAPAQVLSLYKKYFETVHLKFAWGKIQFVGKKKQLPNQGAQ